MIEAVAVAVNGVRIVVSQQLGMQHHASLVRGSGLGVHALAPLRI